MNNNMRILQDGSERLKLLRNNHHTHRVGDLGVLNPMLCLISLFMKYHV